MTYPDKTMYPVASRNDKDFQNLMDVYLDAVFYPNMRENPQVLMQEAGTTRSRRRKTRSPTAASSTTR